MEKKEIIKQLNESYTTFVKFIKSLDSEKMNASEAGKWSPIQQTEHLYKSVQPLATGLFLPAFVLRLLFGRSKRQSVSYDEIVKKYHQKLDAGAKATGAFIPGKPNNPAKVIQSLEKAVKNLCERLDQCSENQLDNILTPHPLLGKITLREMMYFTIYHVQHHLESLQK